jgi:hypothetical protein
MPQEERRARDRIEFRHCYKTPPSTRNSSNLKRTPNWEIGIIQRLWVLKFRYAPNSLDISSLRIQPHTS